MASRWQPAEKEQSAAATIQKVEIRLRGLDSKRD